jgi:hypothetical protein
LRPGDAAAARPVRAVFLDAGGWKDDPVGKGQPAIDLLAPGGLLVKDDLTPARSACPRSGPAEGVWENREVSPATRDPVREWLFGHPDLVATEILTTSTTAAIIAAKRA